MEKFAGALLMIAVALLDRALDAQIDRLKDGDVKETLRRVEDQVVAWLEGAAGKVIAQAIARAVTIRAAERWFENRDDTKHWG